MSPSPVRAELRVVQILTMAEIWLILSSRYRRGDEMEEEWSGNLYWSVDV